MKKQERVFRENIYNVSTREILNGESIRENICNVSTREIFSWRKYQEKHFMWVLEKSLKDNFK